MNEYVFGNTVRITTNFVNSANVLTDPTLVYLTVNRAGEFVNTYQYGVGSQISKLATGVYYSDLNLTVVGGWDYYWFSSGTLAAENGQFIVLAPGV